MKWRERRSPLLTTIVWVALFTMACGSLGGPSDGAVGAGATLETAFALARQEPRLRSLVVARGGTIERQEYFNGGGSDTPEYIWSVTKSVLAMTVGAALDRGCLRSVDQRIGDLLDPAQVTDPRKAAITLRHLLTMTSGLDFPEMASYASGPSLYHMWIEAPDQVAWVLARPLTADPGQRFEYGSGTIHLASAALARACGTDTASFARDHLLTALGIPSRPWEADHQGYTNGGAGLSLSPRDMQAIGDMVLNGGLYRGIRVLPAAWVAEMTRTHVTTGPGMPTPEYGYAWWAGQTAGSRYVLANGWGGQFIFVMPARRLVVTTAALTTNLDGVTTMAQWRRIFDIITQHIVPAYPEAS